jgi:predicted transposase YbfD/YdcC
MPKSRLVLRPPLHRPAVLTAQLAAQAVRARRGVDNSPHWVLEADFSDVRSRLRKGHGARDMANVRHFANTMERSAKDKRSF